MHTATPQQPSSGKGVYIETDGLRLGDGTRLALVSGAVHYWRLARADWSHVLDSILEMGFSIVETYVPWSVHEIQRGLYDFGEHDPAKDLSLFLGLCHSKGLYVFLRPGPNIIAELTGFGFPSRILLDPDIQARTRTGAAALYDFLIQPAPIPCYASPKLYAEFALYLDALFQVIRPHLYPRGPVLGFQADNELGYFFRPAMFDLDYAPDSIALYHRFLRERYGGIAELNQVYHTRLRDFDQVQPPTQFRARQPADIPYYLDWARYKEYYLLYALEQVAAMLRSRGADDLVVYHNYPGLIGAWPTTPYNSPFNLPGAESVLDLCGVDSYPSKETYGQLKSQVQHVAATSRLPFIAEFGSGVWPWIRPALPQDQELTTLTILMHGAKAVNYYMLVERDRWLGAPILRDNRRRPDYFALLCRVNSFLKRTGALNFNKVTPIVLLTHRDYERLAGVSALLTSPSRQFLPAMPPELLLSEERWDLNHAIPIESYHWWRDSANALEGAGYTFDLADTDLAFDRLVRYPVAIIPTFDFAGRDAQEKLVAYARRGGILILGPDVPSLDANMQPCSILAEYLASASAKGNTMLMGAPGDLPRLLSENHMHPRVRVDDPECDVTVHERGSQSLVYLANPTPQFKTVSLTPGGAFRDCWRGQEVRGNAILLEPYTIRILEPVADD